MKKPTQECLSWLFTWNATLFISFILDGLSDIDLYKDINISWIIVTVNLILMAMALFFEGDGEIWLKQMFCKHTKIIVDTKNKTAQCARCGKYHLLQGHE